jgi:hypothetical protein
MRTGITPTLTLALVLNNTPILYGTRNENEVCFENEGNSEKVDFVDTVKCCSHTLLSTNNIT